MQHFLPKRSSSANATSPPQTCTNTAASEPHAIACSAYSKAWALTALSLGQTLSISEASRTPAQADAGSCASGIVLIHWTGRGGDKVSPSPDHPQMDSVMLPSTPFCSGCRWQCVIKSVVNTGPVLKVPTQTAAVTARKKHTNIFKKRANFLFHISLWSTTWTNPTPHHTGQGLAGHPRSVRLGFGDYKTRLLTSVCSKTPAILRRGSHLSAEQGHSRPALRGDGLTGKRGHRADPTSSERVRLLQPLLPRPQKGWWPPTHPRSQAPEPRPHETPRGLVLFFGSERRLLSHPGSPPSQTILEIRLRGGGISIHGPALRTVPGSSHFYEVHRSCCAIWKLRRCTLFIKALRQGDIKRRKCIKLIKHFKDRHPDQMKEFKQVSFNLIFNIYIFCYEYYSIFEFECRIIK